VEINSMVVPLCPSISALTEADDGSDEEEDGVMERASRTGRKARGSNGSGMWTCRWDRAFWRLVRRDPGAVWKVHVDRNLLLDPLYRIFSLLVLCVLVFCPPPPGFLPQFAFQSYLYARLLVTVSRSLVNNH